MRQRILAALPFALLFAAAAVVAAATFVEDGVGAERAGELVYRAWWFRALWAALGVAGAVAAWRARLFRRPAVLLLHLSFAVMMAGALVTALTMRQGHVHLRAHQPERTFVERDGTVGELPFVITLDTFAIDCYPGTDAPRDFTSRVTVATDDGAVEAASVSMNNVLCVRGFRLYQSSFDDDRAGSWLTATFDPYGTAVTYAGYAMLAVAVVWLLVGGREAFARLLRHPALRRGGVLAVVVLAGWGRAAAEADGRGRLRLPVVPREQAAGLKSRQVVYNDRVAPFNTLATDFVQKLYGRRTFAGLTAEQVVVSWQLHPRAWRGARILRLKAKHRVLAERLGLEGDCVSVNDLYGADGTYRLAALYERELGSHSRLEAAIVEIDEKIGIVKMLEGGTLVRPLPDDGSVAPLPVARVRAELLYNAVPFARILFIVNLSAGFLLFLLMLRRMLATGAPRPSRARTWTLRSARALLVAATLFHAAGYGLRWYVAGVVPLTNGYETMQFVALATLLLTCWLGARFSFVLPFGFLVSGFALLVCHLGQMNPQITPLMPVLQSPWLSSHVSVIMVSYAFFAFIALNSALALVLLARGGRAAQVETLTVLNRLLLYPAVLLLAVGIFIGAVWANASWGSYWSWDPKEVWALVTMMVYGAAFHRSSLPFLRRPPAYHAYLLCAFLTVLMTYFGVNYLLGGMHSYAG